MCKHSTRPFLSMNPAWAIIPISCWSAGTVTYERVDVFRSQKASHPATAGMVASHAVQEKKRVWSFRVTLRLRVLCTVLQECRGVFAILYSYFLGCVQNIL